MLRASIVCGMGLILAVMAIEITTAGDVAASHDWPSWRGPQRDGKSAETGLLDHWDDNGPPLAWRIEGLGKGFSSVTIANGKIFTMGKRPQQQAELVALDVTDGKELWSASVGGGDPNCSPTVDGELVYALGRDGDLVCAKSGSGEVVWRKSYPKDFGGKMMSHWGYSESPLVDGEKLICTPGAEKAMIAALNKNTGEVIWKSPVSRDLGPKGQDGAGYSSIIVSEGGGIRQYVQLTGRGLISVAADDGRPLWTYNKVANPTANIPTPIISGDYVFASSGYQTGAGLLKLSSDSGGVKADEVYFLNHTVMQNHHGGMILIGDHIYCGNGHNNGVPLCVEMKTGKVAWTTDRGVGRRSAAVLYADGHLYFRYEDGTMALVEANPEKYTLKGKFKLASNNGASWPHPVIVDGRLYLRDQQTLLCYDVSRK